MNGYKHAVKVPPGPGEAGSAESWRAVARLLADAIRRMNAENVAPLLTVSTHRKMLDALIAYDALDTSHFNHKAPEPGCDLCESALDEARELLADQREAEREAMD